MSFVVTKRVAIAGAVVAVVGAIALAAFFKFRSGAPQAVPMSLLSADPAGAQVGLAGLPPVLAVAMPKVQTEVVSSSVSDTRIVQVMDGTRRELAVRADRVALHLSPTTVPLRTADGDPFYPVRLEFSNVQGGFRTSLAFFIPEDDLPPDVLETLKLRSIARDADEPRIVLAAYRPSQVSSIPGILIQSITTTTSGADIGNAKTGIRDAPADPDAGLGQFDEAVNGKRAKPPAKAFDPAEAAKANQEILERMEKGNEQLRREGRHTDNIVAEGDRKILDAERRASAAKNWTKLGRLAGAMLSALEVLNAFEERANALEGLRNLSDCLHHPVAPTAQRALKEDPAVKRTADRINEASFDVNFIFGTRLVNGAANVAATEALKGSPAQLLVMLMAVASEAMLTDAQKSALSDVASGVVPCETRWVSATVAYSYSESETKPGSTTSVTEIANGKVMFGINAAGKLSETGGWANYRSSTSGTQGCTKYQHLINGRIALYVSGSSSGFKDIRIDGRTQHVGTFDLTLNIEGDDMQMVTMPGMGNPEYRGGLAGAQHVCEPVAGFTSGDARVRQVCAFEDVTPTIGGSFFSSNDESSSSASQVVKRSCRLDLRPLPVKPPPDPADPPPPPRK